MLPISYGPLRGWGTPSDLTRVSNEGTMSNEGIMSNEGTMSGAPCVDQEERDDYFVKTVMLVCA